MVDTGKIELESFQISHTFNMENIQRVEKRNKQLIKGTLKLVKLTNEEMELDFIGFHTSFVNAYRRIILAEVSTMAIEKVYIYNNTSIVQDEVLAHRLGLIPLNVDPRLFENRNKDSKEWGPEDSVKYELHIRSYKEKLNDPGIRNTNYIHKNKNVLSGSVKWIPIGSQEDRFQSGSLGPLHDDILLAKLNPGHEIHLEAIAIKGIGSDHAKFQPGTAWYRLLPEITLTKEVYGNDAKLLQKCFSPGVIDLDTDSNGRTVARVNNARYDSCSRNIYQYDSIKDCAKLNRITDHIIFNVESHSFLKSHEILEEAVLVMIGKCDNLLNELNKYLVKAEESDSEAQ